MQILEAVFASQTLVSTLRGCLSFRIFSLWTLAIAAIWTLSPAGGQGISRAVELQENRTTSTISIQSFPINNLSYSGETFNSGASGGASLYNQWSGLSVAASLGPDIRLMHSNGSSDNFSQAVQQAGGDALAIQSTRSDLWRNVRVPILQLLPGYEQSQPFEWVNVSSDTIPPYESLIGLPIQGMTPSIEGNGTTIISSYYQNLSVSPPANSENSVWTNKPLKCGQWENETKWILDNPTGLRLSTFVEGFLDPGNGTSPGFPNIFLDIFNDTMRQKPSATDQFAEPNRKQVLVFGNDRRGKNGSITLCEITTSYVDSQIACTRPSNDGELSCAVEAVRHTKGLPVSGNLTAFDIGQASRILIQIPYILANLHPSSIAPGILESFLKDPPSAFDTKYDPDQWDYRNLPLDVFSARLSMLINTFLRASLDMPSLVGMNSTALVNEAYWMNTNANWTEFTPDIYDVKKPWFTLYIASTLVMTLCALANIVLRAMTRAPDFLGSVSALTRDTPFIDAPAGGSFMDGTERARLLKDKWVRIQDVKPDEDVGRIAFSDAKGPGRLRTDRQYE